jgi:hypothetical protein
MVAGFVWCGVSSLIVYRSLFQGILPFPPGVCTELYLWIVWGNVSADWYYWKHNLLYDLCAVIEAEISPTISADVTIKLYSNSPYSSHHDLTTVVTFQVFKHVVMTFFQRRRSFRIDIRLLPYSTGKCCHLLWFFGLFGFQFNINFTWDTPTSWKVAGSIPDDVIEVFHWHKYSGPTMALGLTEPLTKMSTRNTSWGVKAAGV